MKTHERPGGDQTWNHEQDREWKRVVATMVTRPQAPATHPVVAQGAVPVPFHLLTFLLIFLLIFPMSQDPSSAFSALSAVNPP